MEYLEYAFEMFEKNLSRRDILHMFIRSLYTADIFQIESILQMCAGVCVCAVWVVIPPVPIQKLWLAILVITMKFNSC